jgi:hypothetical protein
MSLIKTQTKLELEGVGTLTVRASDYLTQGGEGAIYRKDKHIIKLALDQKKLVHSGLPEKVQLLRGRLSHPSIVIPSGMVTDTKSKVVGYHMPYVQGEPYPRLFTNDWRNQHGFTEDSVSSLTSAMHDVVSHAHQAKALLVDANELNWLANIQNVRQPTPHIIDVDSWQIDQFKASVIMPSIRDRHGPICESSDWFAWGVVSFLLYTGIHPYKGKLDGYKPGEMERRMKDNASVFTPGVRLNKAVRDFGVIPGPLLDWYQATFTLGERSIPPSPLATGKATTSLGRVMRTVATTTGGLVYEELLRVAGEKIISVWPCGVVRTDHGNLIEVVSKKVIGTVTGQRVAIVSQTNGWLVAEEVQGQWQFCFLKQNGARTNLSLTLPVTQVIRSEERLFVSTETELVELKLQAFSKPVLTTGQRWQVPGRSTQWFAGIGISDVLGAMHLIVPTGEDAVSIIRTAELDGKRVINSHASGRTASVLTIGNSGQYEVYEYAASKNWQSYTVTTRDADSPELNQTVLPKGVTADIREDGELIITVPTQGTQKVVKDKDLLTTMRLSHIGNQVVYRYEDALWSLRMN